VSSANFCGLNLPLTLLRRVTVPDEHYYPEKGLT